MSFNVFFLKDKRIQLTIKISIHLYVDKNINMPSYNESKSTWSQDIKTILNTEGLDLESQLDLDLESQFRRFYVSNACDITFEYYSFPLDRFKKRISKSYESLLNKYQTYQMKLYWKDEDEDSIEIIDEIDFSYVFDYYNRLGMGEDKTLKIYVNLENLIMKKNKTLTSG